MSTLTFMRLAVLLALAACGSGTPAQITRVADPAPKALDDAAQIKVVSLAGFTATITLGERVGVIRGGWLCTTQVPMFWPGEEKFLNKRDVAKTFFDEFTKANYPVVGDPDEIFKDSDRPDLIIAARMTEVKANYCHPFTDDEVRGETSVAVEWQVFDPVSRRILLKLITRGSSQLDEAVPLGRHVLFYRAMAVATRGLIADSKFQAIIKDEKSIAVPVQAEAVFRLFARPPRTEAIARNMAEVQAASVVVLSGGGHGSGYFISGDGFLLTNAHVVGDAKFVRVRLATGREIAAEVVAVNRVRDVALLKVAETGLVSLPIAPMEAPVGSEVYAVGAPRELILATTVTRGIVSAYRVEDGLRYIQSDVTVQEGNSGGPLLDSFGNVVGMSVSGRKNNTYSVGLNFFIPILEALKGAGIELGEVRNVAQMRALDKLIAVNLQPGRVKPPAPEAKSAATPPAPGPAPAPSQPASNKVASLEPAKLPETKDGTYRSRFTAKTVNGTSTVDLEITVEGDKIRGAGATRGRLVCRAAGEVLVDGTAWINVACSNSGSNFLSWQLAGRFEADDRAGAYIGRLAFANLDGNPGEAVFRPRG